MISTIVLYLGIAGLIATPLFAIWIWIKGGREDTKITARLAGTIIITLVYLIGVSILIDVGAPGEANYRAQRDGFTDAEEMKAAEMLGAKTGPEYHALVAEKKEKDEAARKIAEAEKAKVLAETEKKCRLDVNCWADKFSAEATIACGDMIERAAKYDFEWTNGWLTPRFPKHGWKDQEAGVIIYAGDEIKLQNGFGAWARYTYGCEFDTRSLQAINVVVAPGRL